MFIAMNGGRWRSVAWWLCAAQALSLGVLSASVAAGDETAFAGGSGTADDPYLVETAEHLERIRDHERDSDVHFRQVADIDLGHRQYSFGTEGEGWRPLAHGYYRRFEGTYDGNGHRITNLTIERPRSNTVGLFGSVGPSGKIRNVGLENVSVRGRHQVGGLAGLNLGRITNSYVTGRVSGERIIGGLVGRNWRTGVLADTYTQVDVQGEGGVGGLAGDGDGDLIANSYAAGRAEGQRNTGGLVGIADRVEIRNSYFDSDAVGGSVESSAFARSGDQMTQQQTFEEWDFTDTWEIDEGQGYPYPRWQAGAEGD